jgi:hypothetical protein
MVPRRVRLVAVVLAAALVAASSAAGADEVPAPGSRPWVATLRHPGAAWVLAVPFRLSLATPMTPMLLRTDTVLHRPFDREEYPDPRRAILQTFRLELRGDQDFSMLGVPLNARFDGYDTPIAPQLGPSIAEPLWAGDTTVRLPRELYGGAAVWQRVDGQRALFLIAGSRF